MTEAARKITEHAFHIARQHAATVHKFSVDDLGNGWASIRITIKPQEAKP